jgi:hypothetical protein
VAAPPDKDASAAEIAQLIKMVDEQDADALKQIACWNAGAPAYRENQIAVNKPIISLRIRGDGGS